MEEVKYLDKLIGPIEENFYQLGIKDRQAFSDLYAHLTNLSKTDLIASTLPRVISIFEKSLLGSGDLFASIVENYAQGLDVSTSKFIGLMLIPEIISSQEKWTPDFLSLIPGCSSLFAYDEKLKGVVHSRILDFPLSDQFVDNERSIFFNLTGLPKMISHSTRGFPIPGMTSMNEYGLTLAIHQKFSNVFNHQGEPIIKIAFDVISQCKDIEEAKKLLRTKTSMTLWGLYLSDQSGQVLCLDISGNSIYSEKYDMKESKLLYFNNLPLLKDQTNKFCGPKSFETICQMKIESFKKISAKFKYASSNLSLESLKVLTHLPALKDKSARRWMQTPLNLASVQVTSFDFKKNSSSIIIGRLPKNNLNKILSYEKIFSEIVGIVENQNDKSNEPADHYWVASQLLSKAQSNYDCKKIELAYHQIQMAGAHLHDYPEKWIALLFFVVWQYLQAQTSEDYKAVYTQLVTLQDKLPSFLEDHRLLFKLRLEKICDMPTVDLSQSIENPALKAIYEKEFKLKAMAIKMLRSLIYPRLELPDIIYLY